MISIVRVRKTLTGFIIQQVDLLPWSLIQLKRNIMTISDDSFSL